MTRITAVEMVITKVQVLVNIIVNRVRSRRPHDRMAVSDVALELAAWKQRLCNPSYTKQTNNHSLNVYNICSSRFKYLRDSKGLYAKLI